MAALPAAPELRRVVDVGAGTGKLTAVLAEAGSDVDAVEPDARMRAVLVERLPEVRVQAGRGEAFAAGRRKHERGGLRQLVALGQRCSRGSGGCKGAAPRRDAGHPVELRGR